MRKIVLVFIIFSSLYTQNIGAQAAFAELEKQRESVAKIANKYSVLDSVEKKDAVSFWLNEALAQLSTEKSEANFNKNDGVTKVLTNNILINKQDSVPNIKNYFNKSKGRPVGMGKTYDKGLDLILDNKIEKAKKYFQKVLYKNRIGYTPKRYADYQLAHLHYFGAFDINFDGMPSDIERKNCANTHYDLTYGSKAVSLISAIPEYCSYNMDRVMKNAPSYLSSNNPDEVRLGKALLESACVKTKVNKYNLYHYYDASSSMDEYDLKKVVELSKVVPYVYRMTQDKQVDEFGKNASDLYKLGIERLKKNKLDEAFYYMVRSAIWGGYEAYSNIYDIVSKYNVQQSWYKEESLYSNRTLIGNLRDLSKAMSDCAELSIFKEISKKYFEFYDKEYEKIARDIRKYERAKEEEKRQQRREAWAGVFQVLGEATLSALNQVQQYQQYAAMSSYSVPKMNSTSRASMNVANMNYLLNPMFAAAQVDAKDYAEYQNAREAYQKMTGEDLSMSDWKTMQGAAILNLKNQGYDILAENQKILNQQKADFNEQRKQDKEDWFARYGYDTSSSTNNTTATTQSSKVTTNASNKTVNNTISQTIPEKELDSKQQFKREDVSSDDYHYEKKVTLYKRDGSSARAMFTNKELCVKSAIYYVKIDNMYYKVIYSNWNRFNRQIVYGHDALYFDM